MGLAQREGESSRLVPGQSRLRGRSRRHPSLATDALAVARAVWTPCLPRPRPANYVAGRVKLVPSRRNEIASPLRSNDSGSFERVQGKTKGEKSRGIRRGAGRVTPFAVPPRLFRRRDRRPTLDVTDRDHAADRPDGRER